MLSQQAPSIGAALSAHLPATWAAATSLAARWMATGTVAGRRLPIPEVDVLPPYASNTKWERIQAAKEAALQGGGPERVAKQHDKVGEVCMQFSQPSLAVSCS
jgi:hypothetical protein